jgi:hypothetical protein
MRYRMEMRMKSCDVRCGYEFEGMSMPRLDDGYHWHLGGLDAAQACD